jgi:hypothetical protein
MATFPSPTSAYGVWSLNELRNAVRGENWPFVSLPSDEYFSSVSLLLSGNGTSGAQNSTFLDSSSNNYTVTRTGNVTQGSFSPYSVSGSYDPVTHGGSGYFDGDGDGLTTTKPTFIASDHTVSAWVYPTAYTSASTIAGVSDGAGFTKKYAIGYNSSGQLYVSGHPNSSTPYTYTFSSSSIPLNTWSYITVTRSGNTFTGYVDGSSVGTFDYVWEDPNSPLLQIGRNPESTSNSYRVTGYMSDLRISTAVESATPPTSPVEADVNTVVLLNYNNAGIFDSAGKNVLESVGNVQIDTAVTKFGTGSIEFDGSGDYLVVPDNAALNFGTGDFTAEFWVYFNSVADVTFVGKGLSGAYAWLLQYNSGNLRFYSGDNGSLSSFYTRSWSPSTDTWYHVAFTRESSTLRFFVDGIQLGGTDTVTQDLTSTANVNIGRNEDAGGIQYLNGYLDDLRITKGVARYTENFTPPEAEFPDIAPIVPFTAEYVTSTSASTGGSSAYTFSNISIGDAADNRTVVVTVSWNAGGFDRLLTSATIGGVSATIIQSSDAAGWERGCIIYADVPTGTTADIALTWSAGVATGAAIGVFRLTGSSGVYSSATESSDGSGGESYTTTVTTPDAPSYIISSYSSGGTYTNLVWTNTTERYNYPLMSSAPGAGASTEAFSAGSIDITADGVSVYGQLTTAVFS